MDEQALKKKKLHDLQFDLEVPLSYVVQHSFLDAHESNENMFLFVQTLHAYSVMINLTTSTIISLSRLNNERFCL